MNNFELRNEKFILFVKIVVLLLMSAVMMIFIPSNFDVLTIAWISICQLLVNLVVVNVKKRETAIFVQLFIIFSWFFHCGQIIKYAFKIEGEVPLPFYNYGDDIDFLNAFKFYFFSQLLLVCGCLFALSNYRERQYKRVDGISTNLKTVATILVLIGILPRLYIDVYRIIVSIKSGYLSTYQIYVPTVLNSLAFLFDSGCFLFLYITFGKRGNTTLFVGMIIYKFIVMISGARQYAVCYLIVWIVFYFWTLRKATLKSKILLFAFAYLALVVIDFVGTVRTDGFTWENLSHILDVKQNTLIGDTLGEFGSAFSSLVVAVRFVPSVTSYGLGNSYIAAILSGVPFIVAKIPILYKGVAYTKLLPNTAAFGGSYLGELYYNYSYFGIIGAFAVGFVIGKIQDTINFSESKAKIIWSTIIYVQLLLYVRGYITDMAQCCIWLWLILFVLFNQPKRKMVGSFNYVNGK